MQRGSLSPFRLS